MMALFILQEVFDFLKNEHFEKKKVNLPFWEWSLLCEGDAPRQNNTYDCGAYVLAYARLIVEGKSIKFDNKDMVTVRETFMREVLCGELFPETLLPAPDDEEDSKGPKGQKQKRGWSDRNVPPPKRPAKKEGKPTGKPPKKINDHVVDHYIPVS